MTTCEYTSIKSRSFVIHEMSNQNSWFAIQMPKKHVTTKIHQQYKHNTAQNISETNKTLYDVIKSQQRDTSVNPKHMIARFQKTSCDWMWSHSTYRSVCVWHVCVLISHISVYCKQPTAHKVNDRFALFECVETWIMSVIMRCSPSTLSSRVYLYSINSGLLGFCVESRQLFTDSKSRKVQFFWMINEFELFFHLFENYIWIPYKI